LNDLAVMAPDWLQALAPAQWYQRYGRRVENYHLPKTDAAREELARVVAADGERLLAAVDAATDQPELAQLPTVVTLRRGSLPELVESAVVVTVVLGCA